MQCMIALLVFTSMYANAQTKVTGKVIDADTKEPLIGATVQIKGTTTAASAGLDGTFKLNVPSGSGAVLVVSYVSYITKEISLSGKTDLGEISLKSSSNAMNEVIVTGDVAIDRKTPIAVSSIGPVFIEEHVGANDIPELLKGIPGVMTSEQDGGYGDSRVSIRGFSSGDGNVAYTINGIPVNDPESGALYWSDFSGLTDVASSIQVQRGLGASKIIIPSFGGTVNITTRGTDAQPGGFVSQGIGTNNWNKTDVLVSTGLNSNGWAATLQGSRTQGAGFADGMNFLGYNYFFNLSKVISPSQTLSLNLVGANQTHGQRAQGSILNYEQAPQGILWNSYYGIKNGKEYNPYDNFFSEPLLSLNHQWIINDKSSLSTVLYGLWGDGGGGNIGTGTGYSVSNIPRIGNIYSPIDFDAVQKNNAASPDGSAQYFAYDSHDRTNWYGLRSTYRTTLGKYIDLSAGIDLRYYWGTHYQEVTDLLGANYTPYFFTGSPGTGSAQGNINDPNELAVTGSKIYYYNRDYVESGGVFAQAEYSKNDFTAFVTLSGSENADKRTDYFTYLNSDPNRSTPWVNFTTYQAKAGANYNINSQMNLYANVGYLTKPPYFGNVFENFTNQINKAAVNEKLFSYELGYGFKTSTFSAKVDLYRTSYMDKAFASTYADLTTNQIYTANVTGVDEMHQGAEFELRWRPVKEITLGGMLSLGDYYYTKNAGPVNVYDNTHTVVSQVDEIFLKNEKVTDIAQTLAAGFAEVNVVPQLKIGVTYNYYGNYTAYVPFQNYGSAGLHPYILPNYSNWDLNGAYKFKMAGFDAELIGTVNNLLNSKYIQDAGDYNVTGDPSKLSVYYNLERRFTTTLKVRF